MVCVHEKGMKEPWCLAASTPTESAKTLMKQRVAVEVLENGVEIFVSTEVCEREGDKIFYRIQKPPRKRCRRSWHY